MKSEWHTTTLDKLGRIVTGKTPPTSDSQYYGGDVPFVSPSDMDGRRIISTTGRYLTERGVSVVANARIPANSIMVSCIGSDMGKAAIAGRNCVTNQQINSIIVDAEHCSQFVYYNLSRRKEEIRTSASGSAQPILNKSAFGLLPIDLPSLSEQQAIASILGALDNKIELNRWMNENLETMAHAIYKDWFVDFGPTHAKMEGREPYLSPDLWALFPAKLDDAGKPEGWCEGDISSFCNVKSGKRPPTKMTLPDSDNEVPVYGGNGVSWYTNASLFEPPFIVTGRVGTLGTVFRVYDRVWVSDNALCCFPVKREYLEYLYFIICGLDFNSLNSGSTQPLLTQTALQKQLAIIAGDELICAFSQIITAVSG